MDAKYLVSRLTDSLGVMTTIWNIAGSTVMTSVPDPAWVAIEGDAIHAEIIDMVEGIIIWGALARRTLPDRSVETEVVATFIDDQEADAFVEQVLFLAKSPTRC